VVSNFRKVNWVPVCRRGFEQGIAFAPNGLLRNVTVSLFGSQCACVPLFFRLISIPLLYEIMDTISRENNSLLPMAGVIVGVVALAIGGYAAVGVSHVKATLVSLQDKVGKIDDLQSQVQTAAAANDKAARDITTLQNSTQAAVNQLGTELATIDEKLKHMEEMHAASKPAKAGKGGLAEPVVAGKGEYIVKAGDTGKKIAVANGTSITALTEVNPGISWSHLKIGQKIKLPEPAPAK